MKKVIIIITSIIALFYISYKVFRYATLGNDLEQKIKNGAIILDVRTPREYLQGHISNSVNISLGEIRKRYIELDTSKTYITCCSHGLRSVKVKQILQDKGFKNVHNGGAWSDLQETINKTISK